MEYWFGVAAGLPLGAAVLLCAMRNIRVLQFVLQYVGVEFKQ